MFKMKSKHILFKFKEAFKILNLIGTVKSKIKNTKLHINPNMLPVKNLPI